MLRCIRWFLFAGILSMASAPVCQAGAVSPRQLLDVADIASPVISPDGRSVAFRVVRASVVRNAYDTVWYVQNLDEPWPKRVADGGIALHTSAGGPLAPKVVWSPDDRWIYYCALVDGKLEVWRAAADGSGAEQVTHDAANVRDFALADDGRVLKYRVGATRAQVRSAEMKEYDQGIHITPSVPIGEGLFRSAYIDGRLATQRYGKVWFQRVPLLADVPGKWKEIDLSTGKQRSLAASDIPVVPSLSPGKAGVKGDPWKSTRNVQTGRVAWLTRIGSGKSLMRRPDVLLSVSPNAHARHAVKCQSALCTGKAITGIQWRPGHDEVLFTVTDPHQGLAQSIFLWNVKTGAVRLVVKATGLINGGREPSWPCGVSARVLVCVTASADRPPRLEMVDMESGKRRVLFNPNEALAMEMAKVSVRLLKWKDKQGQWFTGQFYPARHDGAKPAPLFVTYYTCPGFVRGGLGNEWPLVSLAQTGISALCINDRPHYNLNAVVRYREGLSAVRSAVDLLSKRGEIDRAHVGMGGLSFGSEITMWTLMRSHLLAAASVSTPVVSPLYYLSNSMKGKVFFKGLLKAWQLGSPSKTPKRWKEISPAFNVDKICAPILFQHSEEEYMYALDYEIPLIHEHLADLYVFPNEPHIKFQPRHKLAVYERNLDWFRFWLQGYEDPSPSKKPQYKHWRAMRKHIRQEAVCDQSSRVPG